MTNQEISEMLAVDLNENIEELQLLQTQRSLTDQESIHLQRMLDEIDIRITKEFPNGNTLF